MKKKLLSFLLALTLCVSLTVSAFAAGTNVPVIPCNIQWQNYTAETAGSFQQQVYNAMIAVKSTYPDGTSWTNENRTYTWQQQSGNVIYNGAGCAAFAYMLSDAAFGTLPARERSSFAYEDIRPGDILRINNDTHSVVVLERQTNNLIIAEGNINKAVMWGRSLPKNTALAGVLTTRYPEVSAATTLAPALAPVVPSITGFSDVAPGSPFEQAIKWAVDQNITKGKTNTTFGPGDTCTISHILTFLYRAAGSPNPTSNERASVTAWANRLGIYISNFDVPCTRAMAVTFLWIAAGHPTAGAVPFADVPANADYAPAVNWAVDAGITNGVSSTTFAPGNVCTRGQIVTFLYRAVQ